MGSLLSAPKAPKIPEPTPMPDADGMEAEAARRRELEAARARSGRASTILSGDYSKEKLG